MIAIIYGEEEAYTIWFYTGYRYHAVFMDGYQEYGSYRVKDDELVLTDGKGNERVIDPEWNMAFGEDRTAESVKADFSDSVRIIGEFNLNNEGGFEITDNEMNPLKLAVIKGYIDNPYAFEILKAILPEDAE